MSGPVARGPREPPPGRWVATAPAAMYLCFGLYVVALLCVGRFPAVDEVLFKAAGKEWALRGLGLLHAVDTLNSDRSHALTRGRTLS